MNAPTLSKMRSPIAGLPPMPEISRSGIWPSGNHAEPSAVIPADPDRAVLVGKLVSPGIPPLRQRLVAPVDVGPVPAARKALRFGKDGGRIAPLVRLEVAHDRLKRERVPIGRRISRMVGCCGGGENFGALVASMVVLVTGGACLVLVGSGQDATVREKEIQRTSAQATAGASRASNESLGSVVGRSEGVVRDLSGPF